MSKSKLIFLLCAVFVSPAIRAQAIASESAGVIILNPNQNTNKGAGLKRGYYDGAHPLGEEIAEKLDEFEKSFVYYEPGYGAYAVETKVVLKKNIYNKVHLVEKDLIKQVRKKQLPLAEAGARFEKLLDKATPLIDYETLKVETDLARIKQSKDVEAYFSKIKLGEN